MTVSRAEDTTYTTTTPDLDGVDPADPPTEMLPGQLWHGGCPVDFEWVRRTGIDTVLDLADADTIAPPSTVETQGLTYLKHPLIDDESSHPDEVVLCALADLVATLLRDGRKVLVHCTFGRNRSGLLVALVVRAVLGLDGAAAVAYVQERRPRTLNNDTFATWVRSLPAPRGD